MKRADAGDDYAAEVAAERTCKKLKSMELPLATLPPQTTHTHTVIFLHGRGDTAANIAETFFYSRSSPSVPSTASKDASQTPSAAAARSRARASSASANLMDLETLPLHPPSFASAFHHRISAKYGRPLSAIFPSVRWVFPQSAKRPCERAGGQPMSQWFDIWNILDFEDREELQIPGLVESVTALRKLIWDEAWVLGGLEFDDETEALERERERIRKARNPPRSESRGRGAGGLPENLRRVRERYRRGLRRIVLAGISQGGATAAHTFINLGPIPTRGITTTTTTTTTSSPFNSSPSTTTTTTTTITSGATQDEDTEMMDLDDPSPPTPVSDAAGGGGETDYSSLGGGYDDEQDEEPLRLAALVGLSAALPLPGGTLEETREVLALDPPLLTSSPPSSALVSAAAAASAGDADSIVRHTPVLLEHCADDPLVFVEYGRQLRESLRAFKDEGCRGGGPVKRGQNGVEWLEYPDGGHWINSPQGVDDLVLFLKRQGLDEAKERILAV